ncbi:hypothetical protein K470DRAFT_270209 [Piedraia hortae CBS 480.64]|uniref:Uncharacterized protein n=1 Tax=Piedraia hortae CBS 480.64 TaxID=1314780 RepID=A0A6A7C085_9PEZI|nr:hypothetical protein K470DRAFT_270209 [Piedraia hortae CBS 480.64]
MAPMFLSSSSGSNNFFRMSTSEMANDPFSNNTATKPGEESNVFHPTSSEGSTFRSDTENRTQANGDSPSFGEEIQYNHLVSSIALAAVMARKGRNDGNASPVRPKRRKV